jgi:hypothetical protein
MAGRYDQPKNKFCGQNSDLTNFFANITVKKIYERLLVIFFRPSTIETSQETFL